MAEGASLQRAETQPLASGALAEEESSAFECNICYEIAQSPVVTLCGHLYCWPCLYRCRLVLCWVHAQFSGPQRYRPTLSQCAARRWMQVQNHCRVCPVCKAGIEQDKAWPPICCSHVTWP